MIESSNTYSNQLRASAMRLMRLADELESVLESPVQKNHVEARIKNVKSNKGLKIIDLGVMARSLYKSRASRASFFPPDMLGEPAWDMMLDLFVSKVFDKRISKTSACIASMVPSTTALRWLTVLEQHNFVEFEDCMFDARRTWVRLTEFGYNRMIQYFTKTDAYVGWETAPEFLANLTSET